MHLTTDPVKSSHPGPAITIAADAPPDPLPPIAIEGELVFAIDGAVLPERCVACGDTLDLIHLHTIPGRVRYCICREHRIEALAKLAVGAAMVAIALWGLVSPLRDEFEPADAGVTSPVLVLVLLGGSALILYAVPVHAGRLQSGRRRLYATAWLAKIAAKARRSSVAPDIGNRHAES